MPLSTAAYSVDLTRRYHFCASHRLHVDSFTAEENVNLFGKCNSPFGHGHNYTLEVTVRGPVDVETGLAIDQEALNRLVQSAVLQDFDMKYLNEQVPAFKIDVPTTENVVEEIRRRLEQQWNVAFGASGAKLKRVRIIETRKNEFETLCA
jgi:6-pyruvoyltetrahydropterin/6-carboxytetrahydropterin synthase